jgi:hypothetical protein
VPGASTVTSDGANPQAGTIAPETGVDGAGAPGDRARVEQPSPGVAASNWGLAVGVGLCTLALVGVWLALQPRTPDLAAQVYRVGLFDRLGFAVFDTHWYAGHSLPGYSLLYPPLASLLGMRALGALCVLASTLLFVALTRPAFGRRAALWGAAWFALAALGDVWIGRLTFAMGVSLALGAGVAATRSRWLAAGVLAALCAAASPVAGALLALAGLSVALARREWRPLLALALPPAVVVLAVTVLFPEGGGYEPYPLVSFVATVLVIAVFAGALPSSSRLLRVGAVVYLLACLACLLVRTPIGSNVERYAVLLAGPLLVCALLGDRDGDGSAGTDGEGDDAAGRRLRGRARWATPLALLALGLIGVWTAWGPVRETLAVAGGEATSAAYYAPVKRFLERQGPVRVEVPLTRSHWEAAMLAPSVSLARGWEKQLETRYDATLLAPGLDAASYERWLRGQAVSFVALPDTRLDPSSAQEGRLIRGGLPYLREVFASRHWRVYRVLGATLLLSGPGRLVSMGHAGFVLHAFGAGALTVRVHYTRFWTVTAGAGCVSQAPGGWTRVSAHGPGTVVVSARFSLARSLGGGESCRGGGADG